MIPWLDVDDPFPPTELALKEPNGLLAAGADLSPQRLIAAYSQGVFPWFNAGEPILWWSPDPRMVLYPSELKINRSLKKILRNRYFDIRFDTAFAEVMQGCTQPRPGQQGTWITPPMIAAYTRLHAMGVAHSAETWIDDQLAGGVYGIALGRMFFGESMFTRVPNASKIAFVHLVWQLRRWNFGLIDCQMKTAHLATFGAREIPRAQFMRHLDELIQYSSAPHSWCLDEDIRVEMDA